MFEKEFRKALEQVLAEKGSRKFSQTVDLIINLRNVDFSKPENRLNIDVVLPNNPGKDYEVVIFADGNVQTEAKKKVQNVYGSDSIEALKSNKKALSKLAKNAVFLAQPQLMPLVAKSLGSVLGRKGKLPKPLGPNIDQSIEMVKKTVKLQTIGKYLPTLMCRIGKENTELEHLIENATAVLDAVLKKCPSAGVKSIYVKLTMGKPVRVV